MYDDLMQTLNNYLDDNLLISVAFYFSLDLTTVLFFADREVKSGSSNRSSSSRRRCVKMINCLL